MPLKTEKQWWERVRGRNQTPAGYISARRRYWARTQRLSGKHPDKRAYSVPAIARRISVELPELKRALRGVAVPPLSLVKALAKDLGMPSRPLAAVFYSKGSPEAHLARLPGDMLSKACPQAQGSEDAHVEGMAAHAVGFFRAFAALMRR